MAQERPHIGRLFKQVNEALERVVNNDMRPRGVTVSQMHVLMDLWNSEDGELSFRQLESSVGAAQSTIWGLVSRLEGKGLVESFSSPDDGRAKLVRLTEAGRRMCELCREDMGRHEQMLTADLSPDEIQTLASLLERVHASLTEQP